MIEDEINSADVFAGSRLFDRRRELKLSQTDLGRMLGITFQQVQKYEKGHNRISVSRLAEICRVLSVPPAYFFEEWVPKLEERRFEERRREDRRKLCV